MAHQKPQEEFRQRNQGGQSPQQQQGKPSDQTRNPNQPRKGEERNPERNPGGSPGAEKSRDIPGHKFEHDKRDPNAAKDPSVNNDEGEAAEIQRKSAYR